SKTSRLRACSRRRRWRPSGGARTIRWIVKRDRSSSHPRAPDAGIPLSGNESSPRQTLVFDDNAAAAALYGEGDRTLRTLEREFGIHAGARGNEVRLVRPTIEGG